MEPNHYDGPIELAEGVWWVSPRFPDRVLHCNSYLLRLGDPAPGGKAINFLIDPGGTAEFDQVAGKVTEVVGSFQRVSIVSGNHQDPDVVGSLPLVVNRLAPKSLVLLTEDTWRLIALTGIPKDRVRFVERYRGGLRFPAVDRELKIIPSPYCHFTGAFLIFEPRSGCLFTGDLFAGVTMDREMYPLIATEHHWAGIRFFHERYMPCNAALRWIVQKIRQIEGLRMICPQHGSIVPEELIPEFLDRMESLQVGADLLSDRELDDPTKASWTVLANTILDTAEKLIGQEVHLRVVENRALMDLAELHGKTVEIRKLHQRFVENLVATLIEGEPNEVASRIVMKALAKAEQLGLGTFAVDLALEEPAPALPPSLLSDEAGLADELLLEDLEPV
jgi:glyoxylase-like metal-dependent hydrolase (beta-lactamase superfamily II)